MKRLLFLFVLSGFFLFPLLSEALPPSPKTAGVTYPAVTLESAVAGEQACATITDSCTVMNPSTAGVSIWLALVNIGTTCAAGLTAPAGVEILPGGGYSCNPYDVTGYCYNWVGQVCLILSVGVGPVTPSITSR